MIRNQFTSGATSRNEVAPDCGYATAEFAMILPALMFIGISLIWIAGLCLTQLQIQNLAFVVARDLSRGQSVSQLTKLARSNHFKIEQVSDGQYVTVLVTASRTILPIPKVRELKLAALSVGRLEPNHLSHSN